MVSVFTTFTNPDPRGYQLVPLYRFSWACPSGTDPGCTNNEHVSHVYSTDISEGWLGIGYRLDGIEGYVYPKNASQPVGTVKLCRKYYPGSTLDVHDDYILFPGAGSSGTDCSANSDGHTPGGNNYTEDVNSTDWIGWVYPARPPQVIYSSTVFSTLLSADD